MITELAIVACLLASVPALNVAWNLWLYRPAPKLGSGPSTAGKGRPFVSVLIPARDEEKNIEKAVRAALANRDVDLEVVVMDDDSSDATADIVRRIAAEDDRVRLVSAPALPQGWCGKTHACARLSEQAAGDYFLFVDADVELSPDAAGRMVAQLESTGTDLISSVPDQITGTVLERTIIPLIHFVLLGYLPLAGMRNLQDTSWAAGCGQLFMARRDAYETAGGHEAFQGFRHDGLWLPRVFRRAGFKTDLFDASDLAVCRMYDRDPDLIQGFTKNATEGMATPVAIVPWTVLLVGGQVLPFLLLPFIDPMSSAISTKLVLLAIGLVMITRFALTIRFKQSLLGSLLHPVGILLIVAIQWFALFQSYSGKTIAWKGRV
jgi:hypothetical protein